MWRASDAWRTYNHRVERRRLVEDPIVPDVEKHVFARSQQDLCCGCEHPLPTHILEIYHITPKSKSGGHQARYIQLLCPRCNKIKGSRGMEYPKGQVRKNGILRTDLVRCSYPLLEA